MNANLPLVLAQALRPIAPPSSIVHRILEADWLRVDRARLHKINSGEAEAQRDEQAMRLQHRYQDATGRPL